MALTLYRQYRPRTFAALFGQDAARTILQNALARDQVAHAYLFSGPRGTGKTTTARLLARAATCERPIVKSDKGQAVYEPCNECAACTAQLADHAPDVIEIDAASNRGIEDIRQLREQAHYLPLALKRKVYIIDEVHMLTSDAFNALLKTLEEPPSHCLFILATTELHKVPPTIRSRCQLLRFERGSVTAITAKLDQIVTDKKWEIEDGVTEMIAEHASGGFRDAETQLEQLITRYPKLTKTACIEALGITDKKLLEGLVAAMTAGSLSETRDALGHIDIPDQHRCEMVMTAIIEHVRSRLANTAADEKELLLTLTDALTKLLEGYVLIKGSPHPKLVLESTCYEVAAAGQRGIRADQPPLEEVHEPENIPLAIASPSLPKPLHSPITIMPQPVKEPRAPIVELREVAIKDVRLAWKEVIKSIARDNAPLAQMLRETVVHSADAGRLDIHVKYKFHVEKLSEKKNRTRVETLLEQITHEPWRVEYHLKDSLPRRQTAPAITGETAEAAAAVFGS